MHPIAFEFSGLTIHSYGVMVALGFLAGIWTASRRCLRENISPERILDLGPWLIVGAILGARTLYVTTFWREQFAGRGILPMLAVWRGGLVFYGGLIGACLACLLYAHLRKLPLWKLADILAPSIPLGQAFGRIGCFLNGCCYGRACSMPWAVRFPANNLNGAPSTPVHPTEIYSALLNFGLYLALARLFRRKRFDGQVFAVYLVSYALLRSFVEFFRGDYPANQYLFGVLSPGQVVSIPTLAAGLILLGLLPRLARKMV